MSEIEEGKDYIFDIPENNVGSINLKLTSGIFEGVIYNYGKVAGEEDKEKGEFYLQFEYNIVDPNGIENLEINLDFKNHIGDVLSSIISKNAGTYEETVEETEYYEIGTDNT